MKILQHRTRVAMLAATLAVGSSALSAPIFASEWQPASSESLMRMPVQHMDKSLDQSFRESTLFGEIDAAGTQIDIETQRMADLADAVSAAEGEERARLAHHLLMSKASYLELMQDKLELDARALETRAGIYEQVLADLIKDRRLADDPARAELAEQQQRARERLEQSTAAVDALLVDWERDDSREYQSQYSENLSQIERLRQAIEAHSANVGPVIDGQEVTRESYVRHLLANTEAERSVLEQEQLILTYMAKLVSLDAQTLEQSLLDDEFEMAAYDRADRIKPASTVDLFIKRI